MAMKASAKRHVDELPTVMKWIRPVLVGLITGIIVCMVILMIFAAIMAAADIPQAAVTPMAIVAAAAGSFFAGLACAKSAGNNGLVFGAVCGIVLYAVVMIAGLVILKDLRGMFALAKLLIMAGIGGIGGIVGVNTKSRR